MQWLWLNCNDEEGNAMMHSRSRGCIAMIEDEAVIIVNYGREYPVGRRKRQVGEYRENGSKKERS
jgi:hypothetical protein